MMGWTAYHLGGHDPSAPAQNMAEVGDDATQTVTMWDAAGAVISSVPYTAEQVAAAQAQTARAAVETAVEQAALDLQHLIVQLAPGLLQAQADAATVAASSDPFAPILGRVVADLATVAQGLIDALTALRLIVP